MRADTVVLTILFLALPAAAGTKNEIRVPDNVASLVKPVLAAASAVAKKDNEETEATLDRRLAPVLEGPSSVSTEALVVLLGFYLGEHSGEDISCELVARGATALPFLGRYAGAKVVFPGNPVKHARLSADPYATVQARINAGESCKRED